MTKTDNRWHGNNKKPTKDFDNIKKPDIGW